MPATATYVQFAEESLATFWPDASPLIAQHWREIAAYPDIPLDVDLDTYRALEQAGKLCVLTARAGGAVIAYAVFFVLPHPHYRGSLQAHEDVIYVDPAHRGMALGLQLLDASERILRQRGVQVVHHHVKQQHPALGRLLDQSGYTPVETIYSKRLDRESA